MAQDSSTPQFWEERYRGGVTPWDAGGVPAGLVDWPGLRSAPMRILVPGCGKAHDVRFLAERGHDVLAIDFSGAAVEEARKRLGQFADRVRKADFFEIEERDFDLIYERTFMCALPRAMWKRWAARVAELLRPASSLAGFFFFDDNERGPPFGTSQQVLQALLGDNFERVEDWPVPAGQSVPVLAGKERWQTWRRSR